MKSSKRVAIIGAGPMGLSIAYELTKKGIIADLYESDDRVGGMTATFDFNGIEIERYYHFHCLTDYDYFNLLKELGISDSVKWSYTKMGFWFKNKLQDWGSPQALISFKGIGPVIKIRYAIHAFYSSKLKNWHALDLIDGKTWIKKWIGRKAYNFFWKSLFDYKFYNYSSEISAAWIWSRIHRLSKSRKNIFLELL